ncbi:MAG TPA: TauD/TfdA family dioxygenase [Pseudonocardiaceae bacterium]
MPQLTITPSAPGIGAEISGVDLREPLTPALCDEFRRLLFRHRVVFWRDQHLGTAQQVAFAHALGTILEFSSVVDADPAAPGVHQVRGSTLGWHVDASSLPEPPVATMLRAVDVPPAGGDTIWADGVAAYRDLPEQLKQQVAGRYLAHGLPRHFSDPGFDRPMVAHRLVRTHPATGEQHLYLNNSLPCSIIGMSQEASDELLATLAQEYLRPEHQLRFQWSPGAIAMWDNRVVQHTGTHDYGEYPRHLVRICLADFHPTTKAENGARRP